MDGFTDTMITGLSGPAGSMVLLAIVLYFVFKLATKLVDNVLDEVKSVRLELTHFREDTKSGLESISKELSVNKTDIQHLEFRIELLEKNFASTSSKSTS